MYRGRYATALPRLREAILINHTNGSGVSEYRDRLFLIRALEAKGLSRAAGAELEAVDNLIARTSLGPEWLSMTAKIRARSGRVQDAKKLLAMMSRTAADTTTGSSANRDAARDAVYFDIVRGELALAEGRPGEAVAQFEAAHVVDPRYPDALESLAAALAAAGRVEDAVKRYEELIAQRPFGREAQEDWLLAHVRAGELYERLGRSDQARQSYERLLALWKEADADLVALKEARAHVSKLGGVAPAQK
jgi:tetratricopeptide (TPR) repeat protein